MAGEISRLFATLGFKVDERGLDNFQKKLKGLKKQINSSKGLHGSFSRVDKKASRFFTSVSTQATKASGNLANLNRQFTALDAKSDITIRVNEMRNIASKSLTPASTHSATPTSPFVTPAQSFQKAKVAQTDFFKDIKQNYSKVRPSAMQMRGDLNKIDNALAKGTITAKEAGESRRRVNERLGQVYKQQAKDHARALEGVRKARGKDTRAAEAAAKSEAQQSRKKQSSLDRVRKKLIQVERRYDKRSAQLKQIRGEVAFVNRERRKGNITLGESRRRVSQLTQEYRKLQAAQAAAARARAGAAGGRRGPTDPRQAGNHRVISALHSDAGLGAMAGGFAIAQSSRAYQDYVAMQQGLTAATGSSEKAAEEMEYLIDLSQRLGLFVGELGQSFSSFAAAAKGSSLTSQEVRDVFEGVTAQARVLNLSAANTKGVMTAVTQIMNKSTVMAELPWPCKTPLIAGTS